MDVGMPLFMSDSERSALKTGLAKPMTLELELELEMV